MSDERSPLLTPVQVGPYRLPNRMVMAPLTRNRAGEGNVPTDLMATYYRQRASAGLIVSEATQVAPEGLGYPHTPGIHTDAQVDGWQRVTSRVHAAGGRIFLQLWHVGRISHPDLQPEGRLPVAPSAVRPEGKAVTYEGPKPFQTPRALTTEEVAGVVEAYARGARNAYRAGFDGVEVHGANGYLIDQFLRDGTNRRSDRYGGPPEHRIRFLEEVVDAVAEVWGPERVGVRLSPMSGFNDMSDSDPLATFGAAADALGRRGLAYLHVVEPVGSRPPPGERELSEGTPGRRVVERIREGFGGVYVANNAYDRETGEAALRRGEADLIAYGRLFLANPDLPERFRVEAPLNEPDRESFYGGGAEGYVDYPTLEEVAA